MAAKPGACMDPFGGPGRGAVASPTMFRKHRQSAAFAAAFVLVLFALLPALHGLEHALTADADHAAPCAECLAGGGQPGDDGAPASRHVHEHEPPCALCLLLQHGRDLLLPAEVAAAAAPLRNELRRTPTMRLWLPRRAARPPARAPPVRLG